jgi:acetyl esterase
MLRFGVTLVIRRAFSKTDRLLEVWHLIVRPGSIQVGLQLQPVTEQPEELQIFLNRPAPNTFPAEAKGVFMKTLIGVRARCLVQLAAGLVFLGGCAGAGDSGPSAESTLLRGNVAGAPSSSVTLIVNKVRDGARAGADGSFSFSVELDEPAYAELEFDFRKNDTLGVFLLPGEALTLDCDASDIYGTARFAGKTAAENTAFARLQSYYSRIDYGKLFGSGPEEFLRSLGGHQEALEHVLSDYSSTHPELDARFLRFERARILYFGALLRITRLGISGDLEQYVSNLDFNDPSLLPVDTYSRFLSRYTKIKGTERASSDPALKTSINLVTEARYAVAVETYKDPAIRSVQLDEILRNQFVEGDDGPFGCKGIEGLMARFDQDCADAALRADIDKLYRDCLAARNAPVIRPYKTVGSTSLDAHVFPAHAAAPGEKRPAFLYFHGGGWAGGMPEWGYGPCRRLAAKGMVGISFEYRLRWRHGATPIESVADAKSAVRWTRMHAAELGVDPERIVVAGFSAGGHLAAATAIVPGYDEAGEDTSISTGPAAVVLSSAAVDVAEPGWFSECLAGRGEAAALSPAQQVRSGLPPAIVFHGVKDELCPIAQLETFCQNMRAAGNRCELVTFEGGHFREPADRAVIDQRTDEFLRSLGFLE